MRENRKVSFDFALKDSGGLSTYRGVKKYGVELSVLQEFYPAATACEVVELDLRGAVRLYSKIYWKHPGCDLLASGLDYFVFDTSLVCGPKNAARWVELAAGPLGIHSYEDAIEYLNSIGLEEAISSIELFRRRRFKTSPLWPVLGAEWTNRCNRAKQRSLLLGAGGSSKVRERRFATA